MENGMIGKPTRTNRRACMIINATRLFAEQGYTGTSIRKIATRCQVTEAAIYKHFNSKEHLYNEVILSKSRQHRIQDSLKGLPQDGSISDLLMGISSHILNTAKGDPELLRMLLFSSLEGFSGSSILYQEFRQPYIHFLDRQLKERLAGGEIRKVNTFLTSRCFVGMVMDCALNIELWNNLESTTYTAEMTVKNNVPIFAQGLLLNPEAMDGGDSHNGGDR